MDNNKYNKLTESAKSALDQAAQEFSDMILEKAYYNAEQNNTADKEISFRDIIEAKDDILSPKNTFIKVTTKKRRMSLMFSMTGALYAIFGIILYLYQNNIFDTKKDMGLIIAALGILISIMGFFYTQLIATRNLNVQKSQATVEKTNFEYEIVKKWHKLELLGTELMLKRGISDNRAKSISYILDFLSKELSDTIKIENLKKLLAARNQIVHNNVMLSKAEIENVITIANEIINELAKKLN